ILCNTLDNSSPPYFSNSAEILSGPGALLFFGEAIAVEVSSNVGAATERPIERRRLLSSQVFVTFGRRSSSFPRFFNFFRYSGNVFSTSYIFGALITQGGCCFLFYQLTHRLPGYPTIPLHS